MDFRDRMLSQARPQSVRGVTLPRRQSYYPSAADWRDEVLYFLLPDRFSNGSETPGNMLPRDRSNLSAARPNLPDGRPWAWDCWAESGADRWQGGTIRGIISKLDYLKGLGVTTLWIGPIFKQRGHLNTYHGYGVQDFLEVDPRFGTRQDLVDLVSTAHEQGLRIILDIIFNHSGSNWLYPPGTPAADAAHLETGVFKARYTQGRYDFGSWRGEHGEPIGAFQGGEDGAWPVELQDADDYTRAGSGSLNNTPEDLFNSQAEHKRSDFEDLRDFNLDRPDVLTDLALCYKYWIALTDCDGFRLDTLKHVSPNQARDFCGTIKEFANNLGKANFLLIGEIAGGDDNERRYLDALQRNLNAALDIGEMRLTLNGAAKGLVNVQQYFKAFDASSDVEPNMGSHRNLGLRHVSILDDHDHVFGTKLRFSVDARSPHQVVAGVALQLFSLGMPCIYYGTEQAFAGPERSEWQWLPDWGKSDRYLREAMFGPLHPHAEGLAGLQPPPGGLDTGLPGFGPFGTAGRHCFDPGHPAYVRIAAIATLRKQFGVLRYGRQYQRKLKLPHTGFELPEPGQLIAWSRILDDEEALCIVNGNGEQARGGDVEVDVNLNGSSMTVVLNTAQAAVASQGAGAYQGSHPVGSTVLVRRRPDGGAHVEIRDVGPSEVLVLTNHAEAQP
ncbi:MAG: alpha-amylase family glycosyl hydrolase [Chloroflexota bacterium]|nr:alpha-amylase family glycosyl hydrolase [Chloroflexota bacterium]